MKTKSLLVLLFITICTIGYAQKSDYSIFDKKFNFYIANDLGRNGYYEPKANCRTNGNNGRRNRS